MQALKFLMKWYLCKEISSVVLSILHSIVTLSFLILIKSLTHDEAMRQTFLIYENQKEHMF